MRRRNDVVIVDGCVPTDPHSSDVDNLREKVWAYAMDQRAFGPRKLLVAFADADGKVRGLAFTHRAEPIDFPFEACLLHLGAGAAAAVAYLDEPVRDGPPSPAFIARFERLQAIAASHGIILVDWISCDDELFRAARLRGPEPDDDWWNLGSL